MKLMPVRPSAPRNDLTATSFDSTGTIAPPRGIDIVILCDCDVDASVVIVLALSLRKEGPILVIAKVVGLLGVAEHSCKSTRRSSEGSRLRSIGC